MGGSGRAPRGSVLASLLREVAPAEEEGMSHRGPTAAIALVVACGPGTSDTVTTVMQQVTLQVSGHGTVQLSTGHQCKDQCVVSLGNGARVSATASADDGWTFSGWSGSCSGSSSCQFTVDHDLELDASFGPKPTIPSQHVLTAARNGAGSIRSSWLEIFIRGRERPSPCFRRAILCTKWGRSIPSLFWCLASIWQCKSS